VTVLLKVCHFWHCSMTQLWQQQLQGQLRWQLLQRQQHQKPLQ
jgi:hypothetical protein